MNERSFWRYLPSPGSVTSLLLVGLVLLSALVYYRAVKIQRFLEPALAISQPRNEFSKRIAGLFEKEFGKQPSIRGIEFKMGSFRIRQSLLFSREGGLTREGGLVLTKLAHVFSSLLNDEQAAPEISLIMISARTPLHPVSGSVLSDRLNAQRIAGFIQDTLFHAEPQLAQRFATSFAIVTQPMDLHDGSAEINIRIIPSEFLHIKVLERLGKYSY